MPTFDVTIQGKTYHIEIPEPGATPLRVIVDGESFDVGIAGTALTAEPAAPTAGPRPALQPTPMAPQPPPMAPPAVTPLPPLSVALPRQSVARPAASAELHAGGDIVAPMPGTILSVAIQLGQQVDVGQVVCVLEAMKMKNPIRAPHSGIVAEIAVKAGQTVAHGERLVRLARDA
jgi:glutaconyl-CoA/methylmalonyl-CoA decarboxylase subunit gamma